MTELRKHQTYLMAAEDVEAFASGDLSKAVLQPSEEERQAAKQEASDEAERIMASKRAIRDGGGRNRAARRRAEAIQRPKRPRW